MQLGLALGLECPCRCCSGLCAAVLLLRWRLDAAWDARLVASLIACLCVLLCGDGRRVRHLLAGAWAGGLVERLGGRCVGWLGWRGCALRSCLAAGCSCCSAGVHDGDHGFLFGVISSMTAIMDFWFGAVSSMEGPSAAATALRCLGRYWRMILRCSFGVIDGALLVLSALR